MYSLVCDQVFIVLDCEQLKALIDRKTGKVVTKRPRFVKQDQVMIAELQTAGVICLETFKDFPQMARFTLRDEGWSVDKLVDFCDLRCV